MTTELLSWQEALTIAAVIFAITQFMENTQLRRYIFSFGWLLTATVLLVATPLISVVIANLPPARLYPLLVLLEKYLHYVLIFSLPGITEYVPKIYIPKEVLQSTAQLLSNPLSYQVLALSSFTLLLLIYLAFLRKPGWFKPLFDEKLLDKLRLELLDNLSEENLAALCKIIGSYLDKIIPLSSTVQKPWGEFIPPEPKTKKEKLASRCLEFMDVDLSGANFIDYISRQNIRFIMSMIRLAKEHSLWRTGGNIFFNNLFKKLLEDDNSVLTKELRLGGVSGVAKPLYNLIFKSMDIIDNYDVFGAIGFGGRDVSEIALTNTTKGLETSLKAYLSTGGDSHIGNPGMNLGSTIEHLSESFSSMCIDIAGQKEEIWQNKHSSKMSIITGFFRDLQHTLTPRAADARWRVQAYNPIFTQAELSAEDYTLSKGIVEGLFNFLEGATYLKNEEFARMELVTDLHWVLYQSPQTEIIKTIQDKLLEKIKERVEENFKSQYASMTKTFLYLYGGHLYNDKTDVNNPIAQYFRDIFKTRIIAEIRKNEKFRESTLPSSWKFDNKGNLYTVIYNDLILIDKSSKIRGRKVVNKLAKVRRKK